MTSSAAIDSEFRLGLQRVLARLKDKESFSIIQADLGDEDPAIRAGAIRLIGELEHKEFLPDIMDRLQKLYGKNSSQVELAFTIAVFHALEKIGDAAISEELARRFEQLTDKLRAPALRVIAAHGAGSAGVDGFFQGLLRLDTPYPHLRAMAMELYESLAPGHPDVKSLVALIRKSLKDADGSVAIAAARALARLLGERVFELPERKDLTPDVQEQLLETAPSAPSSVLEESLKSASVEVKRAAVSRILAADQPAQAIRDVLRIYSADTREETVVVDRLTAGLGRWNESDKGRLVLVQAFSHLLRRQGGPLEKFLPVAGVVLGDMDKLLVRLRRVLLRTSSENLSDALFRALAGKGTDKAVSYEVISVMAAHPGETELKPAIEEIMAITDERIRKRLAAEVKAIPAGAFIPIKKILKVMPPLRESALVPPLRTIKDLAKYYGDPDLEWLAILHLAGSREAASLSAVCDAVMGGASDKKEDAGRRPAIPNKHIDVSLWVRSLSMDTGNARVRETLLTLIRGSNQPETFRAAVELLTAKVDTEASNILMLRLPSLKGAMRFIVIQAIGRMGDRIHLPVFLSELRAKEEDRKLAGLLGLEKLLDSNPDLPPDTVSAPLYELKDHSSALVRASAISLLVRLKDPNGVDLVSELISGAGHIPVGAYRLVQDMAAEEMPEDGRRKLFQALLSRIGRMSDDADAVCDAFHAVLAGRPFAEFLKPQRQRADAVQDLKELLRTRESSKASADFKISKLIQRRAIVFLDITGFTPRAAKMTAIELGFFLVQVEDEILPFIKTHKGILVKRLGDGFLLSFPGSIEALAASLAILQHLAKKNQLLQEDDRIRLRAGIHVGDVLIDRDDVFGDTVNVAARVETQAKPMCICLTEDVFKELPGRSDAIECLGPTRLKGKEEPLTLYRVRLDVIYEAQTEALQKLMAAPDWLPKLQRFETRLEDRYQRIKEKIEEARQMVEHGDFVHAETLVEEIEKLML